MKKKICYKCKTEFTCKHDESSCWCSDLPNIMKVPISLDSENSTDCICKKCLEQMIKEKTDKKNIST